MAFAPSAKSSLLAGVVGLVVASVFILQLVSLARDENSSTLLTNISEKMGLISTELGKTIGQNELLIQLQKQLHAELKSDMKGESKQRIGKLIEEIHRLQQTLEGSVVDLRTKIAQQQQPQPQPQPQPQQTQSTEVVNPNAPCPLCAYHQSRKLGSLSLESSHLLAAVLQIDYECNKLGTYGGRGGGGDGAWVICEDHFKVSNDDKPCLVYSFGINNEFSFDEDMMKKGCELHCFDPSMGWQDKKIHDRMFFYNLGIAGHDHVNNKGWSLKTFGSIQKQLGFEDRIVEVLKVDTEGAEWESIPEMLQSGALDKVKQFIFEIHFWGAHTAQQHKKWLDVLNALRAKGFKMFYTHENPQSTAEHLGFLQKMSCCYEISFIRPDLQ